MLDNFRIEEALADLHSDEGAEPVMLLGVMPSWWRDALMEAFVSAN
jgi:hypothetical protein